MAGKTEKLPAHDASGWTQRCSTCGRFYWMAWVASQRIGRRFEAADHVTPHTCEEVLPP